MPVVPVVGCRRYGRGNMPVRVRTAHDPALAGEFVIDVRIETFKAIHVARIRHAGPAMDVEPCFERLFRWAASVGAETGRIQSLAYDHPDTVAPGERRSDARVELRAGALPPPGIAMGFVGAGRHAVYRHRGAHEGIADAYRRLFIEWLAQSGEAVDDRPCMEIYRNTPRDTPPEHLVTDLCVPLRDAPPG